MDSEELLAQLADIHLPQAVSIWPPAPGWWILTLLLLGAGLFLGHKVVLQLRLRKTCAHALAELDRCHLAYANSPSQDLNELKLRYVNQFNSIIRRVALYHFPMANVASLGGKAWVDFIREKGDSSQLDEDIAAALSFGRFQTECDVDVEAMNSLGQQWINSLYLGDHNPASDPQGLNPDA